MGATRFSRSVVERLAPEEGGEAAVAVGVAEVLFAAGAGEEGCAGAGA